jgi:prevent-host-death family protein
MFMREFRASEAKARLASVHDAVECGATIVITRHGKPIALIVPEVDLRQAEIDRVIAEIEEFRWTMPSARPVRFCNQEILDIERHMVASS